MPGEEIMSLPGSDPSSELWQEEWNSIKSVMIHFYSCTF
jgi:hypothetical protein